MPRENVFPETSKVDCTDQGDVFFCKLYSGHPSLSGTFIDERDVHFVEAEVTEDLTAIPTESPHVKRKPSEDGELVFEVPDDAGCAFVEDRLTCGSWIGD